MPDETTMNVDGSSSEEGVKQSETFDPAKFRDYIPPELKDDPSLKDVKDLGSLAKMYVNSQKLIGAEKFPIPSGKLDTPEQWEKVYDTLGRPKKPEDYNWKYDEGLPEGVKPSEEMDKAFRTIAHKMGLNQRQAAAGREWWNNLQKQLALKAEEDWNNAADEAERKLRGEFGENYDRYIDLANRVLNVYGGTPDEIREFTDRAGVDPVVIRTLARVGRQLSEDALARGGDADFMLSAEGAKAKAADMMSNKQNPLYEAMHNKMHPRHAEAYETYMRLQGIATGDIKA